MAADRESLFPARPRGAVSRLRWALMPWWAFAFRYREDDDPCPGKWWQSCIGSLTWWLDKILERLPGGALFDPPPLIVCNCDYCRGVPGAAWEP